jgi:hypothetical protein
MPNVEQSAAPAFQNPSNDKMLFPVYVHLILVRVLVYELCFATVYQVLRLSVLKIQVFCDVTLSRLLIPDVANELVVKDEDGTFLRN